MAIRKPSELKDWLDKWNFDIFTWKVYIGDVVENAIDWAISWINYVLSWAEIAYSWGKAAWDKAVETGKDLLATINQEVAWIWNEITTWWDDLNEWWEAKREWVKDRIALMRDFLKELIDDVSRTLQRLNTAWDDFRTTTLPRLIDFSWWHSFWGGAFANIQDWWTPEKQKVSDEIDAKVDPVKEEVNKHASWLDLVKDFFADPQDFLLKVLEKALERFW